MSTILYDLRTIRFSVSDSYVEAELCPVTFLGRSFSLLLLLRREGWIEACLSLFIVQHWLWGYKVYLVNRCFFQIYSVGGCGIHL